LQEPETVSDPKNVFNIPFTIGQATPPPDPRVLWLQSAVAAARVSGALLAELTAAPTSQASYARSQAFHALLAIAEGMLADDDYRTNHALPALKTLVVELDRRQKEKERTAIAELKKRIIIPADPGPEFKEYT
jgi:hypothetical protein